MRQVLIASCALALSACTPALLRTPAWAANAQSVPVRGHSGSVQTFKESELFIGSYAVKNIDRDWDKGSGSGAGAWSRNEKRKAYRFDVQAGARTAHAECHEQAVENSIGGFGRSNVTFDCTCTEGSSERFKVLLQNGKGSATLDSATKLEVSAMHESQQGADVSRPLGYQFSGEPGELGVDVSGPGRAWVQAGLSEDALLGLTCGYAGFLLYRPTT